MKKIYVKPSIKEKEIDMESLLASESGNGISSSNAVSGLTGEGTTAPKVGGPSDGTPTVSAKALNPWGIDAEE